MPVRTKFVRKKNQRQLKGNVIKKYTTFKYPEIPPSVNELYIMTGASDRLDILANQYYKDVDLWWIIATANPDVIRRDSLCLKPGIQIRIPSDINSVLSDFEEINRR